MGNNTLSRKFSNNPTQKTESATRVNFGHEINENIIAKTKYPNELANNSIDDKTKTCLKEFNKIYENVCEQYEQTDAPGSYKIDVDVDCINLNDLKTVPDLGEMNVESFDSFQKNEDGIDIVEQKNDFLNTESESTTEINTNDLNDKCEVEVWKSIYEDFTANIGTLTNSEGVDKCYLDTEVTKNTSTNPSNNRKMSEIDIRHHNYGINFIQNHKEITSRQFGCSTHTSSITQEVSNGRDDTNSITNSNTKVDERPRKVENNEIIIISDDEDALGTVKNNITKNMKPIDREVIELSDDEDPLEILEGETTNKEVNHDKLIKLSGDEDKIEILKSDIKSTEPIILSNIAKLHTEEYSEVELVPSNSECVKPINTIELTTQELQSKGDMNVPATLVDELSKQDPEFISEGCLNAPKNIETNEFMSTILRLDDDCNGYHSSDFEIIDAGKAKNGPNFLLDLEDAAEKNCAKLNRIDSSNQDVVYYNTECSNEATTTNTTNNENIRPEEELVFNNSEFMTPIDTTELSTQDLQSQGDMHVPATLVDDLSKQDPEFISEECLNAPKNIETNEFLSFILSLDNDCDGYRSSDFEFIDEGEAKNGPNFLLPLDDAAEKNSAKPNRIDSPNQDIVNNNTECSNEATTKNTNNENGRPKEELVFNNSKFVTPIDTTKLLTQELQSKNDINVPATRIDEFSQQASELKSKECLNVLKNFETNEFMSTNLSLDGDCDGYHSSDFEFIDEDEANARPNFLYNLDVALEQNTANSGHKFKKPQKINANKRAAVVQTGSPNKKRGKTRKHNNQTLIEKADVSINTTNDITNTKKFLKGFESLTEGAYNQPSEENDMMHNDYLQTLQSPINKQFDSDYRASHRIPDNEEYLHFFSGIYTPYPMSAYGANKEITPGTIMSVGSQGVGFDMNKAVVDDSSPEQRREAQGTKINILTKYSIENTTRPRRRCRRY